MSDDESLICRIAGGDEEALRQLYASYRVRLWQYLWPQLNGDAQRVEEVLQDVFLAVWRQARTFRGEARASTWLFRIARYRASNAMRDRARQPEGYSTSLSTGDDSEDGVYERGGTASHEDAVLDRVALTEGMARLSPKHREVLDLFFYHGFTLDEVAHILDIPTGTVKSRLSYARRALQRELQEIAPLEGQAS